MRQASDHHPGVGVLSKQVLFTRRKIDPQKTKKDAAGVMKKKT